MYANPIYLPEFSNREDLLLTMSLFDDDTGDALDFSGCTRAQAGDYTTNQWLVTSGATQTSSTDVLTIPDYPIGDELQAVALTVDPGLLIAPGDPVTIANLPGGTVVIGPIGPPPTPLVGEDGTQFLVTENSVTSGSAGSSGSGGGTSAQLIGGPNSMTGYVVSYAAATGALVCQIGSTFQCEIRRVKGEHNFDLAYGSSWDVWGTYPGDAPIMTLSLGSGLTMVGTGILQIRSPEVNFRKLNHRTYGLSLTMTDSYDTRQCFLARLPILYGGVTL